MTFSPQHLKARLWLSIAKIVEEETKELNVEPTKLFTATLAELVYNQVLVIGDDLESFAKHGKRKTILPADLYMITRKNDGLTGILKDFEAEIKQNDGKPKQNDQSHQNDLNDENSVNNEQDQSHLNNQSNPNTNRNDTNNQSTVSNAMENRKNMDVLGDIYFSDINDSDEMDELADDSLDETLNEKLNQTINRATKR